MLVIVQKQIISTILRLTFQVSILFKDYKRKCDPYRALV